MKKWWILIIALILSGCTQSQVELPHLIGLNETQILERLNDLGLEVQIIERNYVVFQETKRFLEYGEGFEIGDYVDSKQVIPVIVSADLLDTSEFYTLEEVPYDGPKLLDIYFEKPYAISFEDGFIGGGRAFEVSLQNNGCVDGDTARFIIPEAMIEFTKSVYVRSRFLNFDTPETFPGGKEEFGKPASIYACDLLTQADQIYLQTDPGDNLFDRYGRLLAWVWVQTGDDIELLNYKLVRQGLGEVKYLFGAGETIETMVDGMTYTEWMFEAERLAKLEQLGIYSGLKDIYWDYVSNAPNPYTWTD